MGEDARRSTDLTSQTVELRSARQTRASAATWAVPVQIFWMLRSCAPPDRRGICPHALVEGNDLVVVAAAL
jgi:hypothetical protein